MRPRRGSADGLEVAFNAADFLEVEAREIEGDLSDEVRRDGWVESEHSGPH